MSLVTGGRVPCKPVLSDDIYGSVSRAAKGADCKSAGSAFEGSSPSRPTLEMAGCVESLTPGYVDSPGKMETSRIATLVDWLFSPDWLTFEQACFLSGWNADQMAEIVRENGVDLDDAGPLKSKAC